jgi:hypothetical protein
MSEQMIYNQLVDSGLSPAGACGLMGNMKAESAMRSNNAQDGMTKMSDEVYTTSVDDGSYKNFVRDAVGYGLCQWTYYTRKQELLAFAKARKASIGDETMQVEFCIKELKQHYAGLWKFLCQTSDIYTAASRVCKEYEQPAINNTDIRGQFANEFFNKFANGSAAEISPAPEVDIPEIKVPLTKVSGLTLLGKGSKGGQVKVLQILLKAYGYYNGGIDSDFGILTENAVKAFQCDNELIDDGLVGSDTWTVMLNG